MSSKGNGGALYASGLNAHNGLFTDTDFTTATGRQSLTSKSVLNTGTEIWICEEASTAANAYICLVSEGPNEGVVIFLTVDPTGTANPVKTTNTHGTDYVVV